MEEFCQAAIVEEKDIPYAYITHTNCLLPGWTTFRTGWAE